MGSLANAVGSLFGGAQNNANNVAISAAPIQGVNAGQTGAAINAATAAGGVGAGAVGNQQALAAQLAGQAGQGVGSQNALTSALQAQALGQGPNPAQAALQAQTGQNVANTASLMAGAQGASSNPGLLARQIGQQGAATQQQAVGQGSVLQAQQQLAAQQQLQNLAASQVGQAQTGANAATAGALGQEQATTGQQNGLLSALGQYNTAGIQNAAQQNVSNTSIANNNANNTSGALGGLGQGLAGFGQSLISGSNSGGVGGAAGAGLSNLIVGAAQGGIITKAQGGMILPEHLAPLAAIYGMADGGPVQPPAPKNDDYQVGVEGSPGQKLTQTIQGWFSGKAKGGFAKEGGQIPGEPKQPGKNVSSNDTVPTMLTPKEMVLPLTVTQSEDPGEAAKQFVNAFLKKDGTGVQKEHSDFKKALSSAISSRKSKS